MVVRAEFEKLGLNPLTVELGEVELTGSLSEATLYQLQNSLEKLGFEVLNDKKRILIEKIKTYIISLVQDHYAERKINLSADLANKLQLEYVYLSQLFSEVENTTIEQFFILHRIEKAKELIMYNELSIKEISFRLNFSSVAHLSSQFKKVTGFTPSYFKELKRKKRNQIEDL
jgi:AraC-like DNA-binding protein